MSVIINYALLARAVEWYEANGYKHINVDWMVPAEFCNATHNDPLGHFVTRDFQDMEQVLVGSAEQGFLKAVADGLIEPNVKYMSVTPCFRRGDIGPMNQEWFVKLELSAISLYDKELYHVFMQDARELFIELGVPDDHMWPYWTGESVETATNHDIIYWNDVEDVKTYNNMIELGSYGYREITDLTSYNFVLHYGTGLALPRFQLTQP